MQVKVFYEGKTKIVNTMRTHTYSQLLEHTLKELGVTAKPQNCRLRSFNVPNQTLQDTYTGRDTATLEDLHIYPQKALALEVKADEAVFEEYDPSNIQIKVHLWRPHLFSLDESALSSTMLTTKRTASFGTLLEAIAKLTGIPKERLMYPCRSSLG